MLRMSLRRAPHTRAVKQSVAKIRLDDLLCNLGLAPSKEKAQKIIMAGEVLVDEVPMLKSGTLVKPDSTVRLLSQDRFVGRGGEKLEGALSDLKIEVKNKVCIDIGASTGGFTDCLLQNGAALVYAVDVGTNQLDWKLRNDPRVRSFENTNARNLSSLDSEISVRKPELGVVDVSFISLKLILAELSKVVRRPGEILALVKPQFELPKEKVGDGGLVESEILQMEAVSAVLKELEALGGSERQFVPSRIKGAKKGNQEYFVYCLLK